MAMTMERAQQMPARPDEAEEDRQRVLSALVVARWGETLYPRKQLDGPTKGAGLLPDTGLPIHRLRRALAALVEAGVVETHGTGKLAEYRMAQGAQGGE